MQRNLQRRGLTLVEVAVLCLVLLLLFFLLLPAVYNSKRDARRNGCINNMRQLALACVNHESNKGTFPLATDAPCADDGQSVLGRVAPGTHHGSHYFHDDRLDWQNDGYSWIVHALPFLEEQLLYDRLAQVTENFQRTAFDPSLSVDNGRGNRHPASISLSFLRCPSFDGQDVAMAKDNYGLARENDVFASNYVALAAATRGRHTPGIVDDASPELGGTIIARRHPEDTGVRGSELTDGTSHSLILCESKQEVYSSWYSGQSTWVVGFPPDAPPNLEIARDGYPRVIKLATGPQPTALNYGRSVLVSDAPQKWPWYATQLAGEPRDWGPSSDHGGGVVLHAYADGHTQAIVDTVDPTVYLRLITRAGEEPVQSDF